MALQASYRRIHSCSFSCRGSCRPAPASRWCTGRGASRRGRRAGWLRRTCPCGWCAAMKRRRAGTPPWLQVKQSALQLGYACSTGGCSSRFLVLCLAGITTSLKCTERVAASAFLLSCGIQFDSLSCPIRRSCNSAASPCLPCCDHIWPMTVWDSWRAQTRHAKYLRSASLSRKCGRWPDQALLRLLLRALIRARSAAAARTPTGTCCGWSAAPAHGGTTAHVPAPPRRIWMPWVMQSGNAQSARSPGDISCS